MITPVPGPASRLTRSGAVVPARPAHRTGNGGNDAGAGAGGGTEPPIRPPVSARRERRDGSTSWPPDARPQATFIAHLLATHMNLPQTRLRNRASVSDASQAYRRTAHGRPRHTTGTGKTI